MGWKKKELDAYRKEDKVCLPIFWGTIAACFGTIIFFSQLYLKHSHEVGRTLEVWIILIYLVYPVCVLIFGMSVRILKLSVWSTIVGGTLSIWGGGLGSIVLIFGKESLYGRSGQMIFWTYFLLLTLLYMFVNGIVIIVERIRNRRL
ncbi:MAG: hypothetical protein ACI4GE_05600 [Lachnospiraceae bacterium]|nr:hypothetical protein [Clostridiales bacterium]MDY4770684.1 hypothetical protein [Lachnospiraceae bacterium]